MDNSQPAQTPPSVASASSAESPRPSNASNTTRERRRRSSPVTPTPSRKTSPQLRRNKGSVSKPRAASTSALAALRVDKSRPSLPDIPAPSTPLATHEEEDVRRFKRGASETLQTPRRRPVKAPSPSHSAPTVTTQSALRRRRGTPQPVDNGLADLILAKEIRATTTLPSGDNAKTGTNYVLEMHHKNDSNETFIKIGETRNHGDARRKQIRWTCGHPGYNVPISGQVPSRYWKKIEKLVLAELMPHKYAIDCDCGHVHREYFKPPARLAVEATQRWTQFCESQPWDAKGKLHPFWEERLSNLQASKGLEKATLERRAVLWADFADAGALPFWRYNARLFCHSIAVKNQLWVLLALSTVFNTVMGPNWYLMYLNLTWQFWFLSLYTFEHVQFAWNYARTSTKEMTSPIHYTVSVPQTPELIDEDDTETESLASDGDRERTQPGLAIRGGLRPASSAPVVIDLTSDVEDEG